MPTRLHQTRRQPCLRWRMSQNEPQIHPRTPTDVVGAHITSGRAAASHRIRPFNIDGLNRSDYLCTLATRLLPVPSGSRMNIDPAQTRLATDCYRMNLGCRAIKRMTHPWMKTQSLREGELLLSFLRSINLVVVLCELVLTIHTSLAPPRHPIIPCMTFFPNDPLCP
jgi:hypothetical protein